MACAARCAIHPETLPIVSDALDIIPAPPIALDASRRLWLAQMASRLDFSTRRVRFDSALVPVVAGTYPIVFSAVDNVCAVPIALGDSRRLLPPSWTSWCPIWTERARIADALLREALGTLLCAMGTAGCDRFIVWLPQLASRLPR